MTEQPQTSEKVTPSITKPKVMGEDMNTVQSSIRDALDEYLI